MTGWSRHRGMLVALDEESVDTDQLIPARFMSTPRSKGYGDFLLHDMRRGADGVLKEAFILNRCPDASILVARRNFGSGSSREAAVYALVDFGIRAVIAPSFGDIFASNAVNNGLLPARVSEDDADEIIAGLGTASSSAEIDLAAQTVVVGNRRLTFEIDAVWCEKLINGWDDIDLTGEHAAELAAFRAGLSEIQTWAFPQQENAE